MITFLLMLSTTPLADTSSLGPAEPRLTEPDTIFTSADSAYVSQGDSAKAPMPGTLSTGHVGDTAIRKLEKVTVTARLKPDSTRNPALDATVVELKAKHSAPADLKEAIQAAPGMHIRQNGGVGCDFDLNINGLQGKAIRVFLDGVPLDARSAALALSTLSVEGFLAGRPQSHSLGMLMVIIDDVPSPHRSRKPTSRP
jgi:hypothetical protein